MVADDRLFDMVILPIAAELEQQAVLQVGGGDAGGLEAANSLSPVLARTTYLVLAVSLPSRARLPRTVTTSPMLIVPRVHPALTS